MAHDDMHVVIYKILAYVYSCMKSGKAVDRGSISPESLEIPRDYWAQIMRELSERGYMTGVSITVELNGREHANFANPRVTLDGVEFLMENSMMRKAVRFLHDTKDAVPFI